MNHRIRPALDLGAVMVVLTVSPGSARADGIPITFEECKIEILSSQRER